MTGTPGATANKLRRVVEKINTATTQRDELIRERHEQGAPLRQIAAEADMHHSGVAKVLSRGNGRQA